MNLLIDNLKAANKKEPKLVYSVRVNKTLHEKFKAYCKKNHIKETLIIEHLLSTLLKEEV